MPYISEATAAILGVTVLIIIGIVVEKKNVPWENVFGNVLSFILIIATVDMGYALAIGMLVYLIVGLLVTWKKLSYLYFAFGFKTYGALSLTILIAAHSMWGLSVTAATYDNLINFIVTWIVVAVIIHIIGYIYHRW